MGSGIVIRFNHCGAEMATANNREKSMKFSRHLMMAAAALAISATAAKADLTFATDAAPCVRSITSGSPFFCGQSATSGSTAGVSRCPGRSDFSIAFP